MAARRSPTGEAGSAARRQVHFSSSDLFHRDACPRRTVSPLLDPFAALYLRHGHLLGGLSLEPRAKSRAAMVCTGSIERSRMTANDPSREGCVRLSIVVPCYNEARTLRDCLKRTLAIQDEALRLEIIVVDDASTDDSLAIARDVASQHSEVTVLQHEVN